MVALYYQESNIFCDEDSYLFAITTNCKPGGPITDQKNQQTSELIISIENPVNSLGLVPITTTQVFTSTQSITEIIERVYHTANYVEQQSGETETRMNTLPDSLRMEMMKM